MLSLGIWKWIKLGFKEFVGLWTEGRDEWPFHCDVVAAAAAKSLQSCPTLCDPIDGSPPGSPIPGILQARTLGCHFLLQCMKVKSESEVAQSCPTLSDPMDCSLPGSSVPGIFQARVLEWVPLHRVLCLRSVEMHLTQDENVKTEICYGEPRSS